MEAEAEEFPDVEKAENDEHEIHHVELKACCCANIVASPGGCCGVFWLVIASWIGCAVFIYFNQPCISFNFSDFKVINSEISNNWYQHSLAGDNSYDNLGKSESTSRRRMIINDEEYNDMMGIGTSTRRRLQSTPTAGPFGYTFWTSTDFYYRAIQAISLNVFFYSKNTNNILTNELLEKCHQVEKGIKAFDRYHNHSLIYREKTAALTSLFGESTLYLEAAPGSFLNYIFPQTVPTIGYVYNGNGDQLTLTGDIENTIRTINKLADDFDNVGDVTEFFDFGFNFVNVSSKYLAAIYPFGYQNSSESKDELYEWVGSYKTEFFDKLGSTITDDIGFAYADSKGVI